MNDDLYMSDAMMNIGQMIDIEIMCNKLPDLPLIHKFIHPDSFFKKDTADDDFDAFYKQAA